MQRSEPENETEAAPTFIILNHRGWPAFYRGGSAGNVDLEFISFCGDKRTLAGELGHCEIPPGDSATVKTPNHDGHFWFTVFDAGSSLPSRCCVLAVDKATGDKDLRFSVRNDQNNNLVVSIAQNYVSGNGGELVPVVVVNEIGEEIMLTEHSDGYEQPHKIPGSTTKTIKVKHPGKGKCTTLVLKRIRCPGEAHGAQTGGTDQADIVFP